jgi:Right handed beta helix region
MPEPTTVAAGSALLEESIQAVNFFNGRLLTGRDLGREQDARRKADARVGEGIGPGIVRGLGVSREGNAQQRLLRIEKGLAVSLSGQTLCLGAEKVLALTPSSDTAASAAGSGGFGVCAPLSGGSYVAGDGIYLLTLAPMQTASGKSEVLALEPGSARCNSDVIVEAVQFRLLRVAPELLASFGIDSNAATTQAVSRLRSALAYACFGYPALAAAHSQNTLPYSLLDAMRERGLSACDVPLALVYVNASGGLIFADEWSVRRRVASPSLAPAFSAWLGEPIDALAEAQLAQFQAQLSSIPVASLSGLKASDWFTWLPPAGFLEAQGARAVTWQTFLDARKPAKEVALSPAHARAVLAQALRYDAASLASTPTTSGYRVYRIAGGPWLFVRDAPQRAHAEEIWLDASRAGLVGADNVQTAIEVLRQRSPTRVVLWPGRDLQAALDRVDARTDVELYFESGEYVLTRALTIQGLGSVVVRSGPKAHLRNLDSTTALEVSACRSLDLRGLQVTGSKLLGSTSGALSVVDTQHVVIERLVAECSERIRGQACTILVQHSGEAAGSRVSIRDCTLRSAANASGLVCSGYEKVELRGNVIDAPGFKRPMRTGVQLDGGLRSVVLEDNEISNALAGIVVSGPQAYELKQPLIQRTLIARNELRLAGSKEQVGIHVMGADWLTVSENRIDGSGAKGGDGVRVEGPSGLHVLVQNNHIENVLRGIDFQPVFPPERLRPTLAQCLWRFENNVIESVGGVGWSGTPEVRALVREENNVVRNAP